MMKKFVVFIFMLLLFYTPSPAQSTLRWQEVQPGIWKASIGRPERLTLLKAAEVKANRSALALLPKTTFPLPAEKIAVTTHDHKIFLRFPLVREEQLFGLGLNFQTINQRGRILNLREDHYGGVDNGRTHAPVPFYISSRGYGVLVDAARYITAYVGTGVRAKSDNPPVLYDRNTDKNWDAQPYSDAVEFLVPADGADVYVYAGPTPMNVVQRYNLMNGGGCLPPKWGLGFTQRVPTLYTQDDVLKEVAEFEAHDFPLDFVGLEPGWQSMAYPCTFEWDKTRFPDPAGFLKTLADKGIRTNLWFNPYVSPKGEMYPKVKDLAGTHTVWNGIVPDLTLPGVRNIYKNHFLKHHINIGVGGYKIDEVDGYDFWLWPDVATFPSGTPSEQMRQVYAVMLQRMTTDWFKEKNQRTYGLVRGSNAGASALPYVIYSDHYSHRDFITALINSSFIGVLWVPEARSSKTAEEWIRRMQTACFSPMAMLNAWADKTKPWSFPEVAQAVRDVAGLRMQMIPYLYTTFAQYHFQGIPPFRAMNLVEGFGFPAVTVAGTLDAATNPYAMSIKQDIKDQYMMGDYLLVAPLFEGEKSRKVYLPAGKWFDFYTGELAGENQVIEVAPGLEKIPIFVKDGGIIPMIPVHRNARDTERKLPLEVRHYGTADGKFALYDDDGTTFDYERGNYSYTMLTVTHDANGKLQGKVGPVQPGKPFSYAPNVEWQFMTK
jgi:alpha-glucosidase (family GH31 glycosyl hydrolase)